MTERCYPITITGTNERVLLRMDITDREPTTMELQEVADYLYHAVHICRDGLAPPYLEGEMRWESI